MAQQRRIASSQSTFLNTLAAVSVVGRKRGSFSTNWDFFVALRILHCYFFHNVGFGHSHDYEIAVRGSKKFVFLQKLVMRTNSVVKESIAIFIV